MTEGRFDIFLGSPDGDPLWLETASGLPILEVEENFSNYNHPFIDDADETARISEALSFATKPAKRFQPHGQQ